MSTPESLVLDPGVDRVTIPTPNGPLAGLRAEATNAVAHALLVPGFTGSKEDFAPILAPLAAAGVTALAIDQRGQFESEGPDDPTAYTEEALAADLLSLAGVPDLPLHLVGHSLGGLIARRAVITAASRFASLTLMCSGPGPLPTGKQAELAPMIAALPAVPLEIIWQHKEAADRAKGWVPPSDDVLDFVHAKFVGNNPYCLRAMAQLLCEVGDSTEDLRSAAERASVRLLVTHGADDDAWPPEVQEEMARRLDAKHVVIENALHSPAIQNPQRTSEVLVDFFQRL